MKRSAVVLLYAFFLVFSSHPTRGQDIKITIQSAERPAEANARPTVISLRVGALGTGLSKTDVHGFGMNRAMLQRPRVAATLRGQITDQRGDAIAGAQVILIDTAGQEKEARTDSQGKYLFNGLAPGRHILRVTAPGFADYERGEVEISPGPVESLNIQLGVLLKDEVAVDSESTTSTGPDRNARAIVLRGRNLDALPSNPESLMAFIQALAGTTAMPGGSQISVDGFTDSRLPPKEAIREIRINLNPYSAEFDRPGSGRVEALTKAGGNKLHGALFLNFNDEVLNSRNPFSPVRAPFQSRYYGGTLSGPIGSKRASYFLNFTRYEIDNNAIINALTLDPALNIMRFSQAVLVPQRESSFTSRLDYQLNRNHALFGRYVYMRSRSENVGVGDFSLLSRAYDASKAEHIVQLTETAVLSKQLINETRFQHVRERRRQEGDNSAAAIRVLEAFTGGGPQVGSAFAYENRSTLYNNTTWAFGQQMLKFGGRLRIAHLENSSPENFGGTYTFTGGLAPQLSANNEIILDANGQPVLAQITSLERYRRTLLFQRLGLTPAKLRALGGGATQFAIAGGNTRSGVSQVDLGSYVQDDWRVRPNLTLSLGLRYEAQTNISDRLDFAPRAAFAWSPEFSKARPLGLVVRGGTGIFYDRFGENFILQARRFDGFNQQQFVVTDPDILDLFPGVPTVSSLETFAVPQTVRRVSSDFKSPYSIHSSLSGEKQLPYNLTLSVVFSNTRTLHLLRSRNINAPLPWTITADGNDRGTRPDMNAGNIFEYESSGLFNESKLAFSVTSQLGNNSTLFATYFLNKANSSSEGVGSFPANTYDLRAEFGRSAYDVRHQFYLSGSIGLPYGLYLSPLLIAHSGMPFNITTGRDTNGDTIFTERPAFATDLGKPGIVVTRFSNFDPNPNPGEAIIPRNYGEGPGFVTVNLFLSRDFSFSGWPGKGKASQSSAGGQRAVARPSSETPYKMTFSLQMQNLLNHTNLGMPIGNLTSPFFGQSLWSAGDSGFGGSNPAGNRRIEAQIRFSF
jgi:hypothetical protein